MIAQFILFLIAMTPLRRSCMHESCTCGELDLAQRSLRTAVLGQIFEDRRHRLLGRMDTLSSRLSGAQRATGDSQ